MPPMLTRFVASALLALPLAAFACFSARSEPAPGGGVPNAVTEEVTAEPAPEPPVKVVVGAYINDIQELDFKTNSYAIDLYVWFRWKAPDLDPSKTMEFMNRYASDANIRDELYDKPQAMPDGSLYSIVRYQGQFSTKFQLEKYPFDTQTLLVVMEDTIAAADTQIYLPDSEGAITINPDITLPGFKIGKPEMRIVERPYPTNFGDLSTPDATDYSRVILTIPVTRPVVAMSLKTFVPIGLIVVCAALVFFVRPRYVEGRIGLGITALLTLVALQLTSGASLPDVDYLMMIDKTYLLAYLFIILALVRVVMTSWLGADAQAEASISRSDRIWVGVLLVAYVAANLAVAWSA
jgi:Neurotransmitter-gated ion-channel transmembrane region